MRDFKRVQRTAQARRVAVRGIRKGNGQRNIRGLRSMSGERQHA